MQRLKTMKLPAKQGGRSYLRMEVIPWLTGDPSPGCGIDWPTSFTRLILGRPSAMSERG